MHIPITTLFPDLDDSTVNCNIPAVFPLGETVVRCESIGSSDENKTTCSFQVTVSPGTYTISKLCNS